VLSDTFADLGRGQVSSIAANEELEELLGISDDPADDLEIIRDRIMPGSCQWILRRQSFLDWVNVGGHDSMILWLTGLPAVGKSVLSSFIIDHLQKDSSIQNCYYYFFKSEDQSKRTVGQMLRSLAFQVAKSVPSFRAKLVELYHTGVLSLGRQKVNTIWETIFEGVLFRQNFSEPLFLVIDGLDEADQPETLTRLLSRLHSKNRFRILIVSRMIRELTSSFGNSIAMVHEEISIDDTLDDIRSYTSSVMSATLRTNKGQDELCNKVLAKAHGSFLWVALALEQLKDNWHTQNDIDQVLNDLPEGMEPLYVRMIDIVSEQASRPRTIASRILIWTVCAFRPLEIAELEVVLAPEFGEFLSLKDTITQVCGNFVVVEKSRVALIHDTARQFLLYNTNGLPITIDRRLGNNRIAAACMNFLMNPKKNWRRTLSLGQMKTPSFSPTQMKAPSGANQVQCRHSTLFDAHPFMSYAVTWWAYHVSLTSPDPDLSALVFDFLEQSCLVWINAVALLGDMRTLTRAAQYLKLYIKRKNRKSSNDSLISLSGNRDDELRQWAKDLIRVVGRFGGNLIQNPQSIYKHVVPFCPKGSIISRTYGHVGTLSVAGISSEAWDDCLARLTMGNEECATAVLCKGPYFVTLVGSGTIVVWHAESCGEARRLHHGEWVSIMECSRVSYSVATAGTKTIRVWNINTGEEEFCLPKTYQRRILALSFGDTDDELRIGYDDSTIHCYDLATSTEKWRILAEESGDLDHACPHLVSFSPDACQVLIGYRGRPMLAWSLDSPNRPPQKCIRPEDRFGRHQDSWKAGTPECALWHPELPVVLVLYNDTSLVEWNIEDDAQREIADIGAREMAISPDGNLLLTSDYNGTLSVWTVPEFRLAYQLKYDDMVRSLAFSPDGQRFYDIRGPLCNVWEPDALVRSDDLDREELSSTQDTLLSETISPVSDAGRVQITALICDSEDQFFCCGKDSGAVVLHEMKKGEKIRKLYGHSSVVSITEMAWSRSEKYIASADDCGRVIAKRLRKPTSHAPTWGVYPLLDFRPGEAVSLLLFSSSEDYLLISSSTYDCLWSLKTRKEVCRSLRKSERGCKWVNHPYDSSLLVQLHPQKVRFFHWETLEEVHVSGLEESIEGEPTVELAPPPLSQLSLGATASEEEPSESIERVIQIHKTKAIFEVFPNTGSNDTFISRRRLTLLDIAPQRLQLRSITGLSGRVNRLIGSYQEQVVFLDRQYCFCTWDINMAESPLKRHFFLPKDWLSPGMLRLCTLNKHGTILCPKNGEVAIIRFGINL
jgi:WD40 repeat protein